MPLSTTLAQSLAGGVKTWRDMEGLAGSKEGGEDGGDLVRAGGDGEVLGGAGGGRKALGGVRGNGYAPAPCLSQGWP